MWILFYFFFSVFVFVFFRCILGIFIFMFGFCCVLKFLCIILVWATLNKMLETVNMQGGSGRSVG